MLVISSSFVKTNIIKNITRSFVTRNVNNSSLQLTRQQYNEMAINYAKTNK
jgi:hypothetical protein